MLLFGADQTRPISVIVKSNDHQDTILFIGLRPMLHLQAISSLSNLSMVDFQHYVSPCLVSHVESDPDELLKTPKLPSFERDSVESTK